MFNTYLEVGFDHIFNLRAYDHLLFLIALCAAYSSAEWKKILILVTAFTIGHSLTLAMSALGILKINASLIELLIPVTILITGFLNIIIRHKTSKNWPIRYGLPLFFGFIHGMGFSNFFTAMLGRDSDIILPLFAFNLGVEIGQIGIVGIIMLINFLLVVWAKLPLRIWNIVVSITAMLFSIYMIYQQIF